MRRRPFRRERAAGGDDRAQVGEVRAAAGTLERGLGEGLRRGDEDGGAFLGGGGQQCAGRGGREDDGGAFQQRGEPGPRRADDQQPVVRSQVGVQQQLGQRADQQGRGQSRSSGAATSAGTTRVSPSHLPPAERSRAESGEAGRG